MKHIFYTSVILMLSCVILLAQQGPTTTQKSSQSLKLIPNDDRKIGGMPINEYVNRYANSTSSLDIPPGTSDAQIGRGYDSATNEIKEQCIVFNGTDAELARNCYSNGKPH
jgi:hypothetical protein